MSQPRSSPRDGGSKTRTTEPPSSRGPGRRVPVQSRSVETFNAILEAAARLFADQGYGTTTTHHIAASAHISVGTLYRYFEDKEAIFKELYRREISEMRNQLVSGFDLGEVLGQGAGRLVGKTLELAFEVYARRPELRHELREVASRIPELRELRRLQERQLHEAVHQIISSAPGVSLEDPEISAYLIVVFIESLIDDYVLERHDDYDRRRVIGAATDFILRYALGESAKLTDPAR